MRIWLATFTLITMLPACGDDAGGGQGTETDAGSSADGGPTTGEADLPESCAGACQDLTVTVEFGDASGEFDRAYYGVTAEDGTIHIEAHAGGTPGCPTETSPSPAYTLVIGSVPAPTSTDTLDQDDGVSVAFLDFSGEILVGAPVTSASEESITPSAASLCLDCVGGEAPSDPDGFLAFELSAVFEGGTGQGRVYATHCDSMDQ